MTNVFKVGDFFNVKGKRKGCNGEIISIKDDEVMFVWQYSYIAARQVESCSVKVFEKKFIKV
jgi:hypothetical protein